MRKILQLLPVLLFGFPVMIAAQVKSKVVFQNTSWAAVYDDGLLHKADSLKLLKSFDGNLGFKDSADITGYFGGQDFMTVKFDKKNKFEISFTQIAGWSVTNIKGDYHWKYSNGERRLSLYNGKKLIGAFSIAAVDEKEIKSIYTGDRTFKTEEILLVRK